MTILVNMLRSRILIAYYILWVISLSSARVSWLKKGNFRRKLPENRRSSDVHEWSYATITGPEKWAKDFKNCSGFHQSPVNIDEKGSRKTNLFPIRFLEYNKLLPEIIVQNNGHTVVVRAPENQSPSIGGGDLGGALYNFSQLHFHWGKYDTLGSEHTLNGRRFPMEIHFVHENQDQQREGKTGIVVLAGFFEMSKTDNPHLDAIVKSLKLVRQSNNETTVKKPFRLSSLIPEQPKHYFRYMGSLTTPPCTEGVIWTVFRQPLTISHRQIKEFRNLHEIPEINHRNIYDNFRPLQKLNGRKILETKPSYY